MMVMILALVETSQASSTALGTADYDTCGDAIDNPTEGTDNEDRENNICGKADGVWVEFVMNTTGKGWIKKSGEASTCGTETGWTCLGLREGHDVTDDPITESGNHNNVFAAIRSSEHTGITYDPKLIVVYSVPADPVLKIRKSTYQSTSSTTILQEDDELVLTLKANKTYIIDGMIFAESVVTQPNIKIGFNIPSGAIIDIGLTGASSNSFESAGMIESDYNSQTIIIDLPGNDPVMIKASGTVKTNSTSGNLELWWAQANTNVDATVVKEGSYLRAEEL